MRRAACSGLPTALLALVLPGVAQAAEVGASPDVAVDLTGTAVLDRQTAIDDGLGGILIEGFGGLPDGVGVDAYHEDAGGEVLFSTDVAVSLGGGVTAEPADVVEFAGGGYSIAFDASHPDGTTTNAVPEGANLDAVARDPATGDLILSFDVTVDVGVVADDEDLLRFDGTAFSLELDTSALALVPPFDPTLDVDAVAIRGASLYALSFSGSGSAGGVLFDDEDVLDVDVATPAVWVAFDASAAHSGWSAADLDAAMLPEPGSSSGLVAGTALLAVLASRRVRGARAPRSLGGSWWRGSRFCIRSREGGFGA